MIQKTEVEQDLHPKPDKTRETISRLFDKVAHRYDILNRILSFGIDWYWRRRVAKIAAPFKPRTYLDVATGTGELLFSVCHRCQELREVKGWIFPTKCWLLQEKSFLNVTHPV